MSHEMVMTLDHHTAVALSTLNAMLSSKPLDLEQAWMDVAYTSLDSRVRNAPSIYARQMFEWYPASGLNPSSYGDRYRELRGIHANPATRRRP